MPHFNCYCYLVVLILLGVLFVLGRINDRNIKLAEERRLISVAKAIAAGISAAEAIAKAKAIAAGHEFEIEPKEESKFADKDAGVQEEADETRAVMGRVELLHKPDDIPDLAVPAVASVFSDDDDDDERSKSLVSLAPAARDWQPSEQTARPIILRMFCTAKVPPTLRPVPKEENGSRRRDGRPKKVLCCPASICPT